MVISVWGTAVLSTVMYKVLLRAEYWGTGGTGSTGVPGGTGVLGVLQYQGSWGYRGYCYGQLFQGNFMSVHKGSSLCAKNKEGLGTIPHVF